MSALEQNAREQILVRRIKGWIAWALVSPIIVVAILAWISQQ